MGSWLLSLHTAHSTQPTNKHVRRTKVRYHAIGYLAGTEKRRRRTDVLGDAKRLAMNMLDVCDFVEVRDTHSQDPDQSCVWAFERRM